MEKCFTMCVCATVKTLALRGLPFCGTDEHLVSLNNGNYRGVLETTCTVWPIFIAKNMERVGVVIHLNSLKLFMRK